MKAALISDTHAGFDHNTDKAHSKFLRKLQNMIVNNGIKILIHAGDWSSSKQTQLQGTLKKFRQSIAIPIVTVRGNHDFWDSRLRPTGKPAGWDAIKKDVSHKRWSWQEMQTFHAGWFKENGIHHLENGPFVMEDVIFAGFDGWYAQSPKGTKDKMMMVRDVDGQNTMDFMSQRAHRELNRVLFDTDLEPYRKAVCVTHFPPVVKNVDDLKWNANTRYMEPIAEKYEILCTGHSHTFMNEDRFGCRVLNCGPDYNKPAVLVFDI